MGDIYQAINPFVIGSKLPYQTANAILSDIDFAAEHTAPVLKNNSGGAVAPGDVVIPDTSVDGAFSTTSIIAAESAMVVVDAINNLASGHVCVAGYFATVNVASATTRGQYLRTSATPKKAEGSTSRAGAFAIALSSSIGAGSVAALIARLDQPDFSTQGISNLLQNSSFEYWRGGISVAPDGWLKNGTGSTVARSATAKHKAYSAALTNGANNAASLEAVGNEPTGDPLFDVPWLSGKIVTFSAWVMCSAANRAYISIGSKVANVWSWTDSPFHSGDGLWHQLTVRVTLPTNLDASGSISFRVQIASGAAIITVNYDGLVATEGSLAMTWIPHNNDLAVKGTISIYTRSILVPIGWALCDGNNGTPNLINLFVRASSVSGSTGGSNVHSHVINHLSLTVGPADNLTTAVAGGPSVPAPNHGHGIDGNTDATSILPPYYDALYIMKL